MAAQPEGAVLVAAAGVSAVGLVVHNVVDLPGETMLSPESLYPVLLTAALVATGQTLATGAPVTTSTARPLS